MPLIIASFSFGNNDKYQFIFRVGGIFLFLVMLSLAKLTIDRKLYFRIYISPIAWLLIFYSALAAYGSVFSSHYLLGYWKSVEVAAVALYLIFISNVSKSKEEEKTLEECIILFGKTILLVLTISVSLHIFIVGDPTVKLTGFFPTINPNTLGTLSLILSVIFFYTKKPFLCIFFIIVTLLSGSKTNFISLMILILLSFFFYRGGFKTKLLFRFGLLITMLVVYFLFYPHYEKIYLNGGDWESLSKLSGRLVIWEAVNSLNGGDYFFSKIFHGDGIGIGSRFLYLQTNKIAHSISMHNAWLEIILSAGWIFLLILLAVIGHAGSVLFFGSKSNEFNMILLFILIVVLIRSLTASNISSFQPEMIIFYLILQHAFIIKRINRYKI